MTEGKPTMIQRLNTFRKAITVEPAALLLLSGNLLAVTAAQTLALDKACRVNLNLSEAICDAVRYQNTDDNADNERTVQEYVARIITFKSIITSVLPCVILIFAGGWMDTTGRKKAIMMLPVIGEICVQTNNIINVVFFYQLKVEYLMYIEAVLGSITGGWSIFFLAIFSFIADITTEENRTYRIGLVSFCVYIGMPIGTSLSGYLLKSFGYLTVFIIALLMALTNFTYLVFGLSDPVRTKEHKVLSSLMAVRVLMKFGIEIRPERGFLPLPKRVKLWVKHDNRGLVYFTKTFFSPAHLLNSLRVVLRKTGDHRTLRLFFMLITTCFLFGPTYGEAAIMYMSTRYRFGWDELQYSIFQTYNMGLNIAGTIFSILVISKALGWHDSVLGILSTSSKICASFVYCFAATGTVFYLGPLIDILNGTAFIALRSMFSKTVEPNELGKLNSIVGITEVILPLAYVPLYIQVYTATMQALPGTVFLVGAGLTVPALLVFSWFLYRHRRSVKLEELRNKGEDDNALSI